MYQESFVGEDVGGERFSASTDAGTCQYTDYEPAGGMHLQIQKTCQSIPDCMFSAYLSNHLFLFLITCVLYSGLWNIESLFITSENRFKTPACFINSSGLNFNPP